MTQIKLLKPKLINGSVYPEQAEVNIDAKTAEAWVNAKEAEYVIEPIADDDVFNLIDATPRFTRRSKKETE